jgi:hypothetical protein
MINFHTYKEIQYLRNNLKISYAEIGRRLQIDPRTVSKWANSDQFVQRRSSSRGSILDPYKDAVRRQYEVEKCTGTEIMRSLHEAGYKGGYTTLKNYLRSLKRGRFPTEAKLVLSSKWMLNTLQGRTDLRTILSECREFSCDHDATKLITAVKEGPLRIRNKALTILAHHKGIPTKTIANFLMIDSRTVAKYVLQYEQHGLDNLKKFRRYGL